MTVPLSNPWADAADSDAFVRPPLGSAAVRSSALNALAASRATEAAQNRDTDVARFIDELVAVLRFPATIHQRELLTSSLASLIESRMAS